MKKGQRHNTVIFGTDAENFVGRLFYMHNNPNGHRRPDLISINGRFNPKLSIEVKEGKEGKMSLNREQLAHQFTLEEDYDKLLDFKEIGLEDIDADSSIAHYYSFVSRVRGVTAQDLDVLYANILLEWDKIAIVPSSFIFHYFAISRHAKKRKEDREPLDDIKEDLIMKINRDIRQGCSNYSERDCKNWQNFNINYLVSLFSDERTKSRIGEAKIKLLRKHSEINGYKRILINGPNGIPIYIFSRPEHFDLFDNQLRNTIDERRGLIERVGEERREARDLLGLSKRNLYFEGLSEEQEKHLRRISLWLPDGESEEDYNEKIEFVDEFKINPDNPWEISGIPF